MLRQHATSRGGAALCDYLPFATAVLADALLDRGELDEAAEVLAHVDAAAANPDSIALDPLLFSPRDPAHPGQRGLQSFSVAQRLGN